MRYFNLAAKTRLKYAFIALFVFWSCAPNRQLTRTSSDEWPMYQFSADHNAVIEAKRALRVSWRFDAGSKINGGLAIISSMLYLDTLGGDIIALDVRNGSVVWRAHADNMVMTSPVLSGGLVIVGSGKNLSAGSQSAFTYASDPTVGATVWGRRAGDYVMAFDAATGKLRWRYRTAGEDMPSPVIIGRYVIFANGDFHAYGLDLLSGKALWRTNLAGVSTMASATALGNGLATVSICRDFNKNVGTVAIRASDGQIAWQTPFGNCDSSPTLGGRQLYLSNAEGSRAPFGYGGRNTVSAVDPHNGHKLWTWADPSIGPYIAVGSSERAIAGTFAGGKYFQAIPTTDEMVAFRKDGRVLWRFGTVAPVKMSPLIYNSHVYFGDTAGLLYVLNAANGSLRYVGVFDQPFSTSPPIIVGHTLFVANGTNVNAIPIR